MIEIEIKPEQLIELSNIEGLRYCFESASLVVAHKDGKTLTEFCTAPKSVTTWEEPENPLFTNPRSCGAIEL